MFLTKEHLSVPQTFKEPLVQDTRATQDGIREQQLGHTYCNKHQQNGDNTYIMPHYLSMCWQVPPPPGSNPIRLIWTFSANGCKMKLSEIELGHQHDSPTHLSSDARETTYMNIRRIRDSNLLIIYCMTFNDGECAAHKYNYSFYQIKQQNCGMRCCAYPRRRLVKGSYTLAC